MAKTTKAKAKPAKKPAPAKSAAKTVKKPAASAKPAAKAKPAPKKVAPAAKKPAPKKAPAPKAAPKKAAAPVAKPVAKKPAPAPVAAPKAAKQAEAPKAAKTVEAPKAAPVAAAPAPKKAAAPAPVPEAAKKPEKLDFSAGDFVVYPAHGVGFVEGVETQTIAGMEITLYTICFEKDRMRLKLPVSKVKASGLRKLSSKDRLKDALATLQGRSQTRRIMWSRRAQEYEAKINSGDPVSIAEVLRDLKREGDQSEQSYSERQIYQAALERLAREVAAIEKIDEKKAAEKLEAVLSNVA
ncbi:MAG: CarD family transcriptional regulator [Alphaproteobacteria bacterium]|nr:CarD family transcriptional regulator [Alphaproteobacteria bacterium]